MVRTEIQNWKNRDISVVINDLSFTTEKLVLARATLFEGTGCWSILDVRLGRQRPLSAHLSLSADTINAEMSPANQEDAEFIRSNLREFTELPTGEIQWCSYDMLRRGRTAKEITGSKFWNHNHPIFFTKKEVHQELQKIREFWSGFEGDLASAATVKIENKFLQLTLSQMEIKLSIRQMGRDGLI